MSDSGWIPGRYAPNALYQKCKVSLTAGAAGTDSEELPVIYGDLIKVIYDPLATAAAGSTITITQDDGLGTHETLFTLTGNTEVVAYPMQDGSVTNANGALTTKQSTPRPVHGTLTVAVASATQGNTFEVTVVVRTR